MEHEWNLYDVKRKKTHEDGKKTAVTFSSFYSTNETLWAAIVVYIVGLVDVG